MTLLEDNFPQAHFILIGYLFSVLLGAWGVLGGVLTNLLDAGLVNEPIFLIFLILMINGLLIIWAYTK